MSCGNIFVKAPHASFSKGNKKTWDCRHHAIFFYFMTGGANPNPIEVNAKSPIDFHVCALVKYK